MFFNFNGLNRNIIYIFLVILVLYTLMGMAGTGELEVLIITLPAVIIAITFHEFAHANAADKLGDTTPRNQGRLSLNPLSHIDPFGFILLIFAHIGWGKPVQINPNNFNSNKSRGFCESMVALAGPLMNFFIAIISCFIYVLIYINFSYASKATSIALSFFSILIQVNIGLGIFNLIPLPPLDGEKIFRNILPYNARAWLDRNYQTLYWIFIFLWIFGILSSIVSPAIAWVSQEMVSLVARLISIFIT